MKIDFKLDEETRKKCIGKDDKYTYVFRPIAGLSNDIKLTVVCDNPKLAMGALELPQAQGDIITIDWTKKNTQSHLPSKKTGVKE